MKLVTAAQMRAIEGSSVDTGVSLDNLMENAGMAVADAIRGGFGEHNQLFGKRIIILIGPGNNGADGFVAGRHLANWGANVTAAICADRKPPDTKRESAESIGVKVLDVTSETEPLNQLLESADLVVDAILGTGASRPLSEPVSSILFSVLESGIPVTALDLPTGLNADTGEFDIAGLPADTTLMLGYPKIGPAVAGDAAITGDASVLDIGIPHGLDYQVKTQLLSSDVAESLVPERPTSGHKGTFGSTLIVAGSKEYLGAVTMATGAAIRSGVGLTFVATPEPAYRRIGGSVPEAMYRALPVSDKNNVDPAEASKITLELAERSTSLVFGPGLGANSDTGEFLLTTLSQLNPATPLVLDADALNLLSKTHQWWDRFKHPRVLTPHPGEMGRLLNISAQEVQQDRLSVALEASRKFDSIVVLKGAATLIAGPDGRVNVSPWVNTGLAKGGSGDVLAGLLGGLLAQEPDQPFEMASFAVFIHGYAAHVAAQEIGETGMTASDVIDRLGTFYRDHVQF